MIPIINKPFVDATYNPGLKLISVIWKDEPFTGEEFNKTYEQVLLFGKDNEVENFMADIRAQRIMSPDERKWFQNYVIGQAVNYGLKRAAVVFSGSVFKKFYLNNILDSTKKFNLPLKFFYTREEAVDWLSSELKQK